MVSFRTTTADNQQQFMPLNSPGYCPGCIAH